MNARTVATVLSYFVVTALYGLVLASHAQHAQRSKVAHVANHRADTATGMQWRWQNPLPQGNNPRDATLVSANTGTLVGDYGTITVQLSGLPDGGSNWSVQSNGTMETLWGVSFTDSNSGTARGPLGWRRIYG